MSTRQMIKKFRLAGMREWTLPALSLALVVTISAEARGQVVAPGGVAPGGAYGGYGYGWGGWGSAATPFGRAAMGMGAFARGLGAGDLMSAQAGAVRAETWAELNEYLYQSRMLQRQRYRAEEAIDDQIEDQARQELQEKNLNDPSPQRIASGSALNNILFQLDDPSIPDSLINDAAAGQTVPGGLIQNIPFMFSHKGAAVSLQRLAHEGEGWPSALQVEAFAPLRQRYDQLVEQILQVPEGEPIPDEKIAEARSILGEMYRTIKMADLDGPVAAEALRHLKAQAGMVAMLQEPDVKKVLDEAGKVEQVSLPNLLNFMRSFNLQFGAADSPEEEALYTDTLYPMMVQARDQIAGQFGGQLPGASADQAQARDTTAAPSMFEGFDWDQLGIPSGQPASPGEQPRPQDAPDQTRPRGAPSINPGP
jgi:hypothetical protein